MAAVLAILVLIACLALAGAAYLLSRGQSRRQAAEALMVQRADPYARAQTPGQDRTAVATEETSNPLSRAIYVRLLRSGFQVEMRRVNMGIGVAAALTLLILLLAGPALGGLIVAIAALAAYALITRRAASRRRALLDQLPEFLEHVLRALSAGNTLEESIAGASREAREPVAEVFTIVTRQVRLGAPLEAVLARQAIVYDVRDLAALSMAASVNRQYGGSLRRVIKSLVGAIRSRDAAGRELRALTAESRVSAWVLVGITVGLTAYVLFQNPEYYAEMWGQWSTRVLLMTSVMLQAIGIFVIYRMVRATDTPDV